MNFNLPISKSQLRIFIFCFLTIFIMVCLQYLGISISTPANGIFFPIPKETKAQNLSVEEQIAGKLAQKPNTFSLHSTTQLIKNYQEPAHFNASGYGVMDLDTGEIISQYNAQQRLPIASLTKIMTAVVALDLAQPSDTFTVSAHAAAIEPSEIGAQAGEELTLFELLDGLLLVSANDAAETIKEGIDNKYQQPVFIDAMNEKAKQLGLIDTHFANPQGFDSPYNYSTVTDMAILSHYALTNYPIIAQLAEKQAGILPATPYHKEYKFNNWNGLLGIYPDAKGLKIGNTDYAGKTTIVVADRAGKKIIAIVLGAPDILHRDLWASQLLDLGYQHTLNLPPVEIKKEQLAAKYNTWLY